jgi:hypothetical protein
MTLSEIIKAAIREAGGDGLCNVSLDCGCGVDDLAPCCAPDLGECEIAEKLNEDTEDWFVPLRKDGEE